MSFRIPDNSQHTAVIGMNGSGKTQGASFLISRMRFQDYPFILLDFKREELFDEFDPFPITNWEVPRDPGIYRLRVTPYDVEDGSVDEFLLRIHARGNCGLFVDEAMELGNSKALRLLLTQGRSLKIPCIICTQRPKLVPLAVFTEASYYWIYDLTHPDDRKLIAGYVRQEKSLPDLPRYHFYWYDKPEKELLKMRPVPDRLEIARFIAQEQATIVAQRKARNYL